jgi:hypothetical protein
MVLDSPQELQNQVVHEVSKRHISGHSTDLQGATHSQQVISNQTTVILLFQPCQIKSMLTYILLFQPCQIGSRQLSFS